MGLYGCERLMSWHAFSVKDVGCMDRKHDTDKTSNSIFTWLRGLGKGVTSLMVGIEAKEKCLGACSNVVKDRQLQNHSIHDFICREHVDAVCHSNDT
jgi:hypothetical protein